MMEEGRRREGEEPQADVEVWKRGPGGKSGYA